MRMLQLRREPDLPQKPLASEQDSQAGLENFDCHEAVVAKIVR
jgi:hypothetical protein